MMPALKKLNIIILAIAFVICLIAASDHADAKVYGDKLGYEIKPGKNMPGDDLEIIRKRIVNDLLMPSVETDKINQLLKSIRPDGSWPGINYTDTSRTGFQHKDHLENMLDLSRAYKKPGSEFYNKPEVIKVSSAALDFWIAHDFICANWWWNEMGTPNWMINTLLVLDSSLTEKQRIEGARIASRANLEGVGARPGGDLIQLAGMLGKQALFKRDEAILEKVIKVMVAEIGITTGRGLQPDMSFHHRTDNVISTLTYGTGYAGAFSYWAVKIAGTRFTFPDDKIKLLIDYYLDGISKSMPFGTYPDVAAMNRDLSRKGALGPIGTDIPENLLRSSDYRKAELEELINVRKGKKQAAFTWDRFFWHSEYFSHQRLSWFSSVRMHSSRQNNMEEPHNEEGLKNHHFADGSNFLSRTGKEYFDIFPVWDWQKIPGATIVQKPALPTWKAIAKKGLSTFTGAVTNGKYGAAAIKLKSVHDKLEACKSWFFFDQEYVCLGAGIRSEEEFPVATTLNQCLLNGAVVVKTKTGREVPVNGQHSFKEINWVLHDSVGYLFPTPVSLNMSNTTASGNWKQISHQSSASEELVQKDVFSAWLDHGKQPSSANYAYIVVPGITENLLDQYRKRPEILILANTATMQAVYHQPLNICQVVFYKAGTVKINKHISLISDNPGIVMIRLSGQNKIANITLSDPTHQLKSMHLQVTTKVETSGTNWNATWDGKAKFSDILVTLPTDGDAGKSVILELGSMKK